MSEHPRTRELEGFAAGAAAATIAGHIEDCDRCRGVVAQLTHERERLLARLPAATFVAQVARRREAGARRARRRWLAWGSGVGALAVAAASVLLILRSELPVTGARLKGIGVEVFRRRGERVEPLASDGRVRAGDGLRLSVTLPAADEVSVSFVDAQGRVDAFPGAERLALPAGEHLLPGAVVVDDPCVDLRLVVRTRAGELTRSLTCE
jgi:hypothetical protein